MRKALGWLLALTVLIGTLGTTAGAATAAEPTDIKDRLLSIPGMSLVQEKPYPGYRYFVLEYTQPVDHRHPDRGTFRQRITVLHKDTSRPTVFYTGGYNVSTTPSRREPTQIVDGNQVSLEYRFFTPSRPDPADWSTLDIWQAAADQHRVFQALKGIYSANWLATGGSKGGMTATYYERFYPRDMDGVVAYVAPNDVVNNEDSAYDRFFARVGTKECRDRLNAVQREALARRGPLEKRYAAYAAEKGYTFDTVGGLDRAYEAVVLDYVWGFWQYSLLKDCDTVPADAATASDEAIWTSVDTISGFSAYTDQGLEPYLPYYYQAGTQLGAPTIHFPHIERRLIRYGYQPPRQYVPRSIPMRFRPAAMRDVDTWVRHHATHMLFVYGQNDPWGSERFRTGAGARDSYVLTAPGMNHGANVAGLVADQRRLATARILDWAGLPPATVAQAKPLARYDTRLDVRDAEREPALRP
ncbi:S28 family serine protease [Streptomyces sp. NPDC017248]|uniref:S28 family serine protease n=1 Tax=unclassified Streptomyces TaxID=2593676 RepID=UPI00379D251A